MISVVIPCYNEEKCISECLRSLAGQKTFRDYEVIVVDNGSTDGTAEVARRFESALPLRLISEPRKGRGAARKAGCAAAKGDIILSTDADAVVPTDWIETMVAGFSDAGTVGVTGTCYITDQSWLTNAVFNFVQPAVTVAQRLFFGSYWVLGSNGGFRKDAYEKMGGYNAGLNSQEDTQFSLLLREHGVIRLIPKLRVRTSGRRFSRGVFVGLFEYVRSFFERYLLRKKDVYLRDAR